MQTTKLIESIAKYIDTSALESILIVSEDKSLSSTSHISISDTKSIGEKAFDLVYLADGFDAKSFGKIIDITRDTLIVPFQLPPSPVFTLLKTDSKNLFIYKKKKFADVSNDYLLQGISTDNIHHHKYFTSRNKIFKPFQAQFIECTGIIKTLVRNRIPATFLRASDGDYFFLRRIAIGSARPGRRAITVPFNEINMERYWSLFWENDFITTNSEPHERKFWLKYIIAEYLAWIYKIVFRTYPPLIKNGKVAYAFDRLMSALTFLNILPRLAFKFQKRNFSEIVKEKKLQILNKTNFSSEVLYALVATKWIFKNFPDSIGIIAAGNKIELIKELMRKDEYRKHLGIYAVADYIEIPQKGAANDIDKLAQSLKSQIERSKARVFLVGAGSAKLGLLPILKQYSDAIFIDVGVGIDAIAGICCQDRPYFAEWVNYRLNDFDYSKIDFMDQGNPAWDNPAYKTVTL